MAMRRNSFRSTTSRRGNSRSKNNRPWTGQEISFMRKFYRSYPTTWCARQLGRTVYSVRYKAVDLNIKKANPSVWKSNGSGSSSKMGGGFNRGYGRTGYRTTSRRGGSYRGYRASGRGGRRTTTSTGRYTMTGRRTR